MSATEGLSELYSFTGNKKLSIDVRPHCDVVQLGFKNSESGICNIGISDLSTVTEAIIEDTKTNTFHDLKKNNYEFIYDVLDNEKRFKLHLNTVGIREGITTENKTSVYVSGKTIWINIPENKEQMQVFISDITGKLVFEKDISHSGTATIFKINLRKGVYLVSLVGKDKVKTEKIIIY